MSFTIDSKFMRSALIGAGIGAATTAAADTMLPRDGEKSELLPSKTAKDATLFGSAAAVILARDDLKARGYATGAIAGLVLADVGISLLGSPRIMHYPSAGAGAGGTE